MTRRYYITDGPRATGIIECSADYFGEAALSGRGVVDVHLADGSVDSIAGTRYLEADLHLVLWAYEHADRTLDVVYMGATLASYPPEQWVRWEERQSRPC
ncbi:hypothetical protein ACFQNE_02660 [Gordonia phosphorivorans]|uniref:Uncharacterized protein n=1 Tax=Gordonia phosphorivorans TaxID=1056982 RepID=A0ABV6H4Y7_9ACTN